MKVLLVQKIEGFAGSEKYILELAKEFAQRGVSVAVLIISVNDKPVIKEFIERLKEQGTAYHLIPQKNILSYSLLKRINAVIKNNGYDIVHSNLIHSDVYLSLVKLFFNRKIKLISTKHGFNEKSLNKIQGTGNLKLSFFSIYFQAAYWSEKQVDKSIAVSRWIKDLYEENGIAKNVDVVYNGLKNVEPDKSDFVDRRYSTNQILMVGRLSPIKGHHFAIKVASKIKEEIEEFKMVWLGLGEDERYVNSLKKRIEELGLNDHIHFEGYKKDVYNYYLSSDVIIVPSISEPFGLVYLESFIALKPVVSLNSPITAASEIIENGKNGFLIEQQGVNEFASKIILLLKDKRLSKEMGEKGYGVYLEKFTVQKMVEGTLQVYDSILESQ